MTHLFGKQKTEFHKLNHFNNLKIDQLDLENYGCLSSAELPAFGLCYLAEQIDEQNLDPRDIAVFDHTKTAYKIHAYLDKAGRLFSCSGPLKLPPAYPSIIELQANPLYDGRFELVYYADSSQGASQQDRHKQKLAKLKVHKKACSIDQQLFSLICDHDSSYTERKLAQDCPQNLKLPELMALAYFVLLPELRPQLIAAESYNNKAKRSGLFDLIDQLKQLQHPKDCALQLKAYKQHVNEILETCKLSGKHSLSQDDLHLLKSKGLESYELYFAQLIDEYDLCNYQHPHDKKPARGQALALGISADGQVEALPSNILESLSGLGASLGARLGAGLSAGLDINIAEEPDQSSSADFENTDPIEARLGQAQINLISGQIPLDELPTDLKQFFNTLINSADTAGSQINSYKIFVENSRNNDLYYCGLNPPAYNDSFTLFWSDKLELSLNRCMIALLDSKNQDSLEALSEADMNKWLHPSLMAPKFETKAHAALIKEYEGFDTRLNFIKTLRSYKLPHRLEVQYRLSADQTKALIHLWCPPLAALPKLRYLKEHKLWWKMSEAERNVLQSHYCAQVLALSAATLFASCPQVDELLVQLQSFEEDMGTVSIGLTHFKRSNFSQADIDALNRDMNHQDFFEKFGVSTILTDSVLTVVHDRFELDEPPFENSLEGFFSCYAPQAYQNLKQSDNKLEPRDPQQLHPGLSLLETKLPDAYHYDLQAKTLKELSIQHKIELSCALDDINWDDFAFNNTQDLVLSLLKIKEQLSDEFGLLIISELIESLIKGWRTFGSADELIKFILKGGYIAETLDKVTLLVEERKNTEALELLAEFLGDIEDQGFFVDDQEHRYKSFNTELDYCLYRSAHPEDCAHLHLVHELIAHAYQLAASIYSWQEDYQKAESCIKRCLDLSPYDESAHMQLCKLYFVQNKNLALREQALYLLENSLSSQLIAMAYSFLALDYGMKREQRVSIACSSMAYHLNRSSFEQAAELLKLEPYMQNPQFMSFEEASMVLLRKGITLAPNSFLLERLGRIARAAVSCSLFPLAQQALELLLRLEDKEHYEDILESIRSSQSSLSLA